LKLGSLALLEPSVPIQACRGIALYLYATVHKTIPIMYLPWIYPVENIPELKWLPIQVSGWGLFWQAQSRPTAGIL